MALSNLGLMFRRMWAAVEHYGSIVSVIAIAFCVAIVVVQLIATYIGGAPDVAKYLFIGLLTIVLVKVFAIFKFDRTLLSYIRK